MVQEVHAASVAGQVTRHWACDADFSVTRGARVWMLQTSAIRFQNATEARQCVAGLVALCGTQE